MTEPAHILVIDDDDRLRDLLRRFLSESGFRVSDAADAQQALQLLSVITFDMLVVDVMMPGETGVEFLASIRKNNDVPALFLTALSETENRIDGLEAGADDYISKPFEPRELILRIQRILARRPQVTSDHQISFGAFAFDIESGRLTEADKLIHITTAEKDLLTAFARRPNETLSRDDLSASLAGRMEGRSIDVAIARLRRKIESDPKQPHHLITTRGAGWLLRTAKAS